MMKFKLSLLLSLFMSFSLFAQDSLTVVAIGEANVEADKIFIPEANVSSGSNSDAKAIVDIFRNNFSFYRKQFEVVSGQSSNSLAYADWSKANYRYVLQFSVQSSNYTLKLFDINAKEEILNRTGSMTVSSLRSLAHDLADQAYRRIAGRESIFKSRIFFVSDSDARGEEVKELYVMDFDGHQKKRLTTHRGTVISPAVSQDGRKVLYSLIEGGKHERNVNLHLLDLDTMKSEVISKRPGINSGAVFMPDNNSIALTLSHTGQADIYVMNLTNGNLRRLSNHGSPDVDPSINVDATLMTFLSGRSGAAMIYTMDPMGTEQAVKRISYVGQYNATPRFSPDGKEIVFSSWLDQRFDLFRIGSDGHNLVRLTKDFGSNEDPSYSPDGQFIAFTSQRVLSRTSAVQNIYIMDREGEIFGSITDKHGNCISPRWSKY
jgi:TolB protein